jgi:hypothetical protein
LPTNNTTARMRAWRALKAAGAAVLRDGVYALPDGPAHRATLADVAQDVNASGGFARQLQSAVCEDDLRPLFDRQVAYAEWQAQGTQWLQGLPTAAPNARTLQRLRKALEQTVAIDFFPGPPQQQAKVALARMEEAWRLVQSPGEPQSLARDIPVLDVRQYQGRTWATRARPGVDRLASAWLIRRFIDNQARFVWLHAPAACPKRAIGFDFDGATFTHVGNRVTFEVLLAAFGLETPPLVCLGQLVHALDAGGPQPPQAPGVECVLAGMRTALADDDALALAAAGVFEGLFQSFGKEPVDDE